MAKTATRKPAAKAANSEVQAAKRGNGRVSKAMKAAAAVITAVAQVFDIRKMGVNYDVVWVQRDKLTPAKYNPRFRATGLISLAESIKKWGMLNPILVDPSYRIAVGHRRWMACGKLFANIEWVPVRIVGYKQADIFREDYQYVKSLNAKDTLEIYLKDASQLALSKYVTNQLDDLVELMGRSFVQKMHDEGFTAGAWYTAKRIGKIVDDQRRPFLKKTMKWLIKHRNVHAIQRNLKDLSPTKLRNAINNGRTLTITHEIG